MRNREISSRLWPSGVRINRKAIDKWTERYPTYFWAEVIPTLPKLKPVMYVITEPEPGHIPLIERRFIEWSQKLKADEAEARESKPRFAPVPEDAI